MKKLWSLAVIPLALLASCEPEDPGIAPIQPEITGSSIAGQSPPSITPEIPGSNPSTIVVSPEWGSIPDDDAFYHCEVLEEESEFCDEYFELEN